MDAPLPVEKVTSIEVEPNKPVSQLLAEMGRTGFQGRTLSAALDLLEAMLRDPTVTIMWGLAGSLSTTGQWKILKWFIDNGFVDVLVTTGANISEDLIEPLGFSYYQYPGRPDDVALCDEGYNRYHDVCGKEADYLQVIELIAKFIETVTCEHPYSAREFLSRFGQWLRARGIDGLVASAAARRVPIFSPALLDSAYGDAVLLAKSRGFGFALDAAQEYVELMSLPVEQTAAVYIGGGVPKDVIQTFAVSADLLFENRMVPGRTSAARRAGVDKSYYPHKYGVQITTDAPQWGGLSGATFEEGISWGKQDGSTAFVQCYCDATIALPLLAHGLSERISTPRSNRRFFEDGPLA